MGTITPSLRLMENTTEMRRLNTFSLFMYVTSLTCDFSDFDEEMVVSLTRGNLIALENDSKLSFVVEYLGCVSSVRRNLEML